jgi:hypothetical protein
VTEPDDIRRSLTGPDAAWADEFAKDWAEEDRKAEAVAEALGDLIESEVRRGVPRDEAKAAIFAEYQRLCDEWRKSQEPGP